MENLIIVLIIILALAVLLSIFFVYWKYYLGIPKIDSMASTNLTAFEDLPGEALQFIPKNGFVFVSGGLTSPGSRIAINFDERTYEYFINSEPNSSPYIITLQAKYITDKQMKDIVGLYNNILQSDKEDVIPDPQADFNVILIMSESKDSSRYYKRIDSFGPLTGEIEELYSYVWRLAEE